MRRLLIPLFLVVFLFGMILPSVGISMTAGASDCVHSHSDGENVQHADEAAADDCANHSTAPHCRFHHHCCSSPVVMFNVQLFVKDLASTLPYSEMAPRFISEPLLEGPFQPPRSHSPSA